MDTLNNIFPVIAYTLLLALVSPLVTGFIAKLKNFLRMRIGPGIFQPYRNIRKLLLKDEVVSRNASWIFSAAPAVVFASTCLALFFVSASLCASSMTDRMILLLGALFVLGLGRFFLALAGLDAGSSFGGMGSSREMFISSFAEPAVFIAVFVLCMNGANTARVSCVLAVAALFLAALAETSRIPVDNRETHLELTMVHEAMVLEYSGRSLALIEMASHIKQIIFFAILINYTPGIPTVNLLVLSAVIALVEISVAKMRLFRVVDYLSFSFLIALVASITAGLGL